MSFLDKYLTKLHKEAGEDFDKAKETPTSEKAEIEDTSAKHDDDKIGEIHDSILRIEKMLSEHLISKSEASEEEKTVAEDEEKKEENKDE